MTSLELIERLRRQGVELKVHGDRLRCNAPMGVLTEQDRRELTLRKREIIDHLQKHDASIASKLPPLKPISRMSELPLSFAQQRLWLMDQFQPETPVYNVPIALRLTGALNCVALQQSFEAIVARHEILRSRCRLVDGEPVLVIDSTVHVPLPVIDLQSQVADAADAEARRLTTEEARRPFDLATGPLLRTSLIRLRHDDHLLLITTHHFVMDGWSMLIFGRELSACYEAFTAGRTPQLPALPVQYVDVADWQRRCMELARYQDVLAYWVKHLANLPRPLQLPSDRTSLNERSGRGATHGFTLTARLSDALRAFSRNHQVSLFVTLLSTFQTLLHRYTRADDIVVGTAVSNRNHVVAESLIGTFANNLVLRTNFSGNPRFLDLLDRVRDTATRAFANQDVPFQKLVECLRPERTMQLTPLVQVMFTLHRSSLARELAWPDLRVSPVEVDTGTARFDLNLSVTDDDDALRGRLEYRTDLFDQRTIERMVGHLNTLLESVVAAPDQTVGELPLMTEEERKQLLVTWNDTVVDYPRGKCVHELFEEQVERSPDAVALVSGDLQMTYRELNNQANRLAHHLRELGVGSETLVGLCVERSPHVVVGILGILKAGAAYVPLAPHDPLRRLEYMLAASGVRLLVTQNNFTTRLSDVGCQLVCLDDDEAMLASQSTSNLPQYIGAGSLAYVMYTSGSTGQPKGVAIRHASIVRLMFGNNYATFGADRVFLLLAPTSFDASTFELWGALLHGAKLVIAPDGLPDFGQLASLLEQHHVTTLWLTTTLFNEIVHHDPQVLKGVNEILTGGESLSVQHICRAQMALGQNVQLVNGYGPTEGTTFTTCYRIPAHVSADLTSIPIGRPIGNTQVFVLDERRQPVPIGIPGELYIGGDGLARAYLNRPELTNEKFVAHPFSIDREARLYRTGDLCRWRPDGNLEFLDRLDDQVKVRGYRIELREIEAALTEHPSVTHAVVLLRTNRSGDKSLEAYCVLSNGATWDIAELVRHVRTRLSDFMIPAKFIPLDKLPLTPSGKVDRLALLEKGESHRVDASEFVGPRNLVETQLAQVWCEALGLERVGIHDNFFAIGGHSLLLLKIFAAIQQRFRQSFSPSLIFTAPTIAELAIHIVRAAQKDDDAPVLINNTVAGAPIFFSHSFKVGHLIGDAVQGRHPMYLLKAQGSDAFRARFRDLATLVGYYVQQIRRVAPQGPYILGGYSFGGTVMVEVARRLLELGESVDFLFVIDPPSLNSNATQKTPRRTWRDRIRLLKRRLELFAVRLWLLFTGKLPLRNRHLYVHKIFRRCLRGYKAAPLAGVNSAYLAIAGPAADSSDWDGWRAVMQMPVRLQHFRDDTHDSIIKAPAAAVWQEEILNQLKSLESTRKI